MRMKNRFCRMGKTLLGAVCLLSTCGVTYSCSDDFDLDETKPAFLGESIYDELKNRHNFTTVIRLIDELGYKDVLSQTGSKTLFVADDDAYKKFFETQTAWYSGFGDSKQLVRKYEDLSTNQKRLLLNGSMLNNAYVLEMLTTIQGPVKNLCLRQLSGISATDSVTFFYRNELPNNLNEGQDDGKGNKTNVDKKFWDVLRNNHPTALGFYVAMDKTEPMFTHFLEAQLNEKKITHEDVSFIMNLTGEDEWKDADTENRSYAYDCRIIEADKVCLNGYFHVLDKVMVTPPNMAELIRTNGETNLFSQMLDRFSAPYYDATLTQEYHALHPSVTDSVYQKLYISQRSSRGAITQDSEGETLGDFPSLPYDPGWNAYTANSTTKEQDMAAMFVPSDAAMQEYFLNGGGKMLIERYGTKPNTVENLSFNLYQIPLNVVKPLVANLMKESFNESVPSKYLTIMNDAQDQMFSMDTYPSVADYKSQFSKVMIANNGVVYVMKGVVAPATFSSVMAPALYDRDAQVMNTVIHADDSYVTTNFGNAPLRKFYSTYLLAMQSNFTLFVPMDDGLKKYGMIEPMGFASGNATQYRYWNFVPEEVTAKNGKYLAVSAKSFKFRQKEPLDAANSSAGSAASQANNDLDTEWGKVKKLLLTDMVDHHILVHDISAEGEKGINTSRQYFLSRSGAPVYIKSGRNNGNNVGMKVDGGLQIWLNNDQYADNDFDCEVKKSYDKTRSEANGNYGNGMTYFIDRPMQATMNTVEYELKNNTEFSKFYEACYNLDYYSDLIETLFHEEGMSDDDWSNEEKKYQLFSNNYQRFTQKDMRLIRFFNNYRYTIFVPDNDAMDKAYKAGLPTMEYINDFIQKPENLDEEGRLKPEAKDKAKAMVVCYANFLKYHFCDQSVFVDNCTDATDCQSACTDASGTFISVSVDQKPGVMSVIDRAGRPITIGSKNNVMARDYELDARENSARSIKSSSYVVLHSLPDYMLFDASLTGGFDAEWKSAAKARAFVKKFPLK